MITRRLRRESGSKMHRSSRSLSSTSITSASLRYPIRWRTTSSGSSLVATGWTGALADFIAAHELTHAIGRNHIPFCGAKGSDVPGYPSPASMGRIYAGSIHQAAFTSPDDFDLGFDGSNFLPANSAV